MRGLCLDYLNEARPGGMTIAALLPLICIVYPDATTKEMEREIDYLQLSELLVFSGRSIKLTAKGVDVIEGAIACPAGILKPGRT